MKNLSLKNFSDKLASNSPTPGGGGASGLVGALAASLASMVANLSIGKKKFADQQGLIKQYISKAQTLENKLLNNIQEDEDAFLPLSKAYSLDKEDPSRDEQLEACLKQAANSPFSILQNVVEVIDLLKEVQAISTKLAISDVAVSATFAQSALQGAAVNVYVNTRLMKDRDYANQLNKQVEDILNKYCPLAQEIYQTISMELSHE